MISGQKTRPSPKYYEDLFNCFFEGVILLAGKDAQLTKHNKKLYGAIVKEVDPLLQKYRAHYQEGELTTQAIDLSDQLNHHEKQLLLIVQKEVGSATPFSYLSDAFRALTKKRSLTSSVTEEKPEAQNTDLVLQKISDASLKVFHEKIYKICRNLDNIFISLYAPMWLENNFHCVSVFRKQFLPLLAQAIVAYQHHVSLMTRLCTLQLTPDVQCNQSIQQSYNALWSEIHINSRNIIEAEDKWNEYLNSLDNAPSLAASNSPSLFAGSSAAVQQRTIAPAISRTMPGLNGPG